ncbi:DASH family cryptochrome [Ferrimonas balearica]|uniref:DASH family cryptochrome n=1 Tax=Ferrimonas balearica TaxID=44012 RepID=UPI001C98F7F9|nr:DASH family cryptochrome [Ferrimonas balearica]MBY5920289.1 DASH family cryptochrome [Ferrimonas balearica]MBY5997026.1 DASH family cryptochrome [Ferrimonas balearica]
MKRALLWFRHDLRLDDHPALLRAAEAKEHLICLYCVEPRWFVADNWQCQRVGAHPWRFILEALSDLNQRLEALGQRLVVQVGDPLTVIPHLMRNHWIDKLIITAPFGEEERQQYLSLQHWLGPRRCEVHQAHTLFTLDQLPFALSDLPGTFSQFRKAVKGLDWRPIAPPVKSLPPPLPIGSHALPAATIEPNRHYHGGQSAGEAHLGHYFSSDAPKQYKLTRNALDDWESSTKLSPWLAQGCLSPRRVMAELEKYEAQHGANESTEWIGVELLWREYFQWTALAHGTRLFAFSGTAGVRRPTSFYPERFARWCQGQTPYPIVNASMRQLNCTGFLSNRARQLVASALVHELGMDWRYGAAYFQQQLIDHDVACNWGNWQYLAGVGADPRGWRHFDLEKQTELYDPERRFIRRWQGEAAAAMDSQDSVGWPVKA